MTSDDSCRPERGGWRRIAEADSHVRTRKSDLEPDDLDGQQVDSKGDPASSPVRGKQLANNPASFSAETPWPGPMNDSSYSLL